MIVTRMAIRHPEKKHFCKNMCERCYKRAHHRVYKNTPKYKEMQKAAKERWKKAVGELAWTSDIYINSVLRRKYKITLNDYNNMYVKQQGRCFLCEKEEITKSIKGNTIRLAVDHCHKTGKVRKLLCMKCNTAINILEKYDIMEKAIQYIKDHEHEQ